ncbi:HEAT repeat domain-containing protein [Corallococcus exercitus]|uniref:HEAT repeat domain-containing protein n=1 Tax=Corallococcus exercitus TaxID=2316736 RepID=UPI001ABFC6D7|nr:HEAT repeat domain-containing protein [Corallococcus exercitus]
MPQAYYRIHSTTAEGLNRIVEKEPELASEVLNALLSDLVGAKRLDEAFEMAKGMRAASIPLPFPAKKILRKHLRAQLVRVDSPRFRDLIGMDWDWLKGSGPVALFVDAVTGSHRRVRGWYTVGTFLPPAWTESQWARVRESRQARAVARHYIRWALPFDHEYKGALASWLWRIGWDLTADFQQAVKYGLKLREESGLSEAVHGILMSPTPPHDELLETLLGELEQADQRDDAAHESIRRRAKQKALNEFDADVWMEPSAECHGLWLALTAAVRERRRQQGYGWLLEQPRHEEFLGAWSLVLSERIPPHLSDDLHDDDKADEHRQWELRRAQERHAQLPQATAEELRAFYQSCMPDTVWALGNVLNAGRVVELVPQLLETLAIGESRHLNMCMDALGSLSETEGFSQHLLSSLEHASEHRRAAILFLVRRMDIDSHRNPHEAYHLHELLTQALDNPDIPALRACILMDETGRLSPDAANTLSGKCRSLLGEWSIDLETGLGRAALMLLAALGEDVTERAWAAFQAPDVDIRKAALRAFTWMKTPEARAALKKALGDEDYECRLLALRGLAPEADGAERQVILTLAQDESARVREACVDAIREGKWWEGLDVLCQLLADSRNARYGDADRNVDHHVAYAAAKALASFRPLPSSLFPSLLAFIRQGRAANLDIRVHGVILDLLAPLPVPELPRVLADLLRALALNPGEGSALRRALGKAPGLNPEVLLLRFGVLTALVMHFSLQPSARTHADAGLLRELSRQPQEEIAQMALLGLRILGEESPG